MKRFLTALTLATSLAGALPLFAAPPAETPAEKPAALTAAAVGLSPVVTHKKLRVAYYQGPGASEDAANSVPMKAFRKDPNLEITIVSPDDIRAGKLAGFDVLIQPGGSGGGQGKALGEDGREKVRSFVKGGGGYIGICGGAYLASSDYEWSLHIINTKVIDKKHWARGHGPVKVGFTENGKKVLGSSAGDQTIIYWQGPLMAPAEEKGLEPYQEWGRFDTEIADKGAPKGVMVGTTAIAAAPYGSGRVVCFSPHPEKTDGQEPLLHHALLWATHNESVKDTPKK